MRRKTLSTRTMTRIGCRRMGCFNSTAYREGCRQRRQFAAELGFWGGLALTLMTGGAALPLAAIFMAPKILEWLTRKLEGN
jgi:hypothetical protein